MRKRVDRNQAEIVKTARELGASVADIHEVGRGVPDLVIGYKGVNLLVEVKSDSGRLTPTQERFISQWMGRVYIVKSSDDLKKLLDDL